MWTIPGLHSSAPLRAVCWILPSAAFSKRLRVLRFESRGIESKSLGLRGKPLVCGTFAGGAAAEQQQQQQQQQSPSDETQPGLGFRV